MRFALACLLVFLAACNEPESQAIPETAAETAAPAETTEPAAPPYSESDVPPALINGEEVLDLLQQLYPESLKREGTGGTVVLWMQVDESGAVTETRIQSPSGHEALDDAAREIAAAMRFTPAENKGTPVSVWIAQPIEFRPGN